MQARGTERRISLEAAALEAARPPSQLTIHCPTAPKQPPPRPLPGTWGCSARRRLPHERLRDSIIANRRSFLRSASIRWAKSTGMPSESLVNFPHLTPRKLQRWDGQHGRHHSSLQELLKVDRAQKAGLVRLPRRCPLTGECPCRSPIRADVVKHQQGPVCNRDIG